MNFFRRAAAIAGAAVAVVAVGQGTASASVQWDNDVWGPICVIDDCDFGGAEGAVTWGNRTAEVSGHVWDYESAATESTVAYFTAYAGSTAIQGTTRAAHNEDRSFRFTIGDPDLVGGVNRVKIQICYVDNGTQGWCSTPVQVWRD
jgi:hypothetical protein